MCVCTHHIGTCVCVCVCALTTLVCLSQVGVEVIAILKVLGEGVGVNARLSNIRKVDETNLPDFICLYKLHLSRMRGREEGEEREGGREERGREERGGGREEGGDRKKKYMQRTRVVRMLMKVLLELHRKVVYMTGGNRGASIH